MIPHRCPGCTRLFYPDHAEDVGPLRCDAVIFGLSDEEVEQAFDHGKRVVAYNRRTRRKSQFDAGFESTEEEDIRNHAITAAAEIGVSRILNLPWTGGMSSSSHALRDVGDRYEVRYSYGEPMLRVRERDLKKYPPDTPFILVIGRLPIFTMLGWARLADVAIEQYFVPKPRFPPVFWQMPGRDLHDLRRLPERRHVIEIYDDIPDGV